VTDEWDRLAGWWADEAVADPAFASDVLPLAAELLAGVPGPLLDLGCGEGRTLRGLAGSIGPLLGIDASAELAARASAAAPVVRARLPFLDWVAGDVLGGAYAVLMIEHIEDIATLFAAVHRAVRSGGVMVVVANHPVFTAEGAAPITGFGGGGATSRRTPSPPTSAGRSSPSTTAGSGSCSPWPPPPGGCWRR
jgi:SAM-dependent methyltransferase